MPDQPQQPDLSQIYTAIKNADAAGDSESVRKLGAYLQTIQAQPAESKPVEQPKSAAWGPSTAWDQGLKGKIEQLSSGAGRVAQGAASGVMDPLWGIGRGFDVYGFGDKGERDTQARTAEVEAERKKMAPTEQTQFDAGRLIGNVAPMAALPAGAGANALTRLVTTMASGALANALPRYGQGASKEEAAKQGAVGAVVGGVLYPAAALAGKAAGAIGEGVQSGVNAVKRWLGAEMPSSLESAAVHKVLETFGRDEAAGGPKLTEVMDVLDTARAEGKPMALADTGKANVNALTGYLSRQPGEASSTVNAFLDTRDAAAGERLHSDITKYVSGGDSMKQTADALVKARAAAARPLYEEAMQPGSTAPLQEQLSGEFRRIQTERMAAARELATAERGITTTAAKASQAGQVGDLSMRGADAKAGAQAAYDAAQAKLGALDTEEAKLTPVLREAQRAQAAGERGGVWSPRLQQFLDDPIVKSGIRKGLEVQRLESLAEGRPFNASDYAIKGTGPDGEPILGAVPNMRLLDASKRGLDEILEGYRDKTTGRLVLDQRGRAIDQVRKSLIDELDRLNPSYKAARDSWAGPSQSLDAMQRGRDLLARSPEEITAIMKSASPNEKEFLRLGLADRLRQNVDQTRFAGDESKAIIKNKRTMDQIRATFEDPKEAQKFIDNVMAETRMFATGYDIRGNSATARRMAADSALGPDMEAAVHSAEAAHNALSGNLFGAARNMFRVHQALGWRRNQALNAEIAKLLVDPSMTLGQLQMNAGNRLLASFPGPATQNYLAQGARNALARSAPLAAVAVNQGINQ